MINAWEDFSIEAPTPNMFSSSSGLATSIAEITNVPATRFSQSKHTIKRRTTTLTSYLDVNQIAFLCPTKFSTICNALKWGSNMKVIMLWTCLTSKELRNSKKCFITFITYSHILLCKRWISTSNKSNISSPTESSSNWASISIVKVMVSVKASDNNQWPLLWFITQVDTTWFKVEVIASTIANTWALDIIRFRAIHFCLP